MNELLSIRGLRIGRTGDGPEADIVKGVDVSVARGQVLGIVGETGAGKTLTMRALLGALPEGLSSTATSATFDDEPMADITKVMRGLRGDRIGIVVQDPVAALPPIRTVGHSLTTILRTHRKLTRKQARERVEHLFAEVGLPDPRAVFRMRPHELSGGMAQRVVIAAAFLTDPDLIIADEPTTALDPTVQLQILTLLKREVANRNAGAVIITHDMGVVAQVCTHVTVLYAGEVKESGTVEQVLTAPKDPYTIELLRSIPDAAEFRRGSLASEAASSVILEARNITKTFPGRKKPVLDGVSISVAPGKTTAIVGESGAGKTTLVRTLLKLESIDSGQVLFDGSDVTAQSAREFRPQRRNLQVVYQNPSAALNPRVSIENLLVEPLLTFPETAPTRGARADRARELMNAVRLDTDLLDRFPGQLSGGQKQRVAIARALATRPKVIVLDEPTASLDVSVRRHVLDLLSELQESLGIAYVLISHDFNTVRHLAHEVTVLYQGTVVESGPAELVLTTPREEYTKTLIAAELSAIPVSLEASA